MRRGTHTLRGLLSNLIFEFSNLHISMKIGKKALLLPAMLLTLSMGALSGCSNNNRHNSNQNGALIETAQGAGVVTSNNSPTREKGAGISQSESTPRLTNGTSQTSPSTDRAEILRRQEEELERQRRELLQLQETPQERYSVQQQEQMQEDDRLFDERGEDFARPY
jgi:hypothetical protein